MNSAEILVVEDSPTQAEALRMLLERRYPHVSVAADGDEALAMARRRKPALVISDIVMPGMDGYSLCEKIKTDPELKDVPVILITTLSDPKDIIKGLGNARKFTRNRASARIEFGAIQHERQQTGFFVRDH